MKYFLTFLLLLASPCVSADTIRLTNGYTIFGKVQEAPSSLRKPDHWQVIFSNGGWLLIKKAEVKSVEVNNRDAFEERVTE